MRSRTPWLLAAAFAGVAGTGAPLSGQLARPSVVEVRDAEGLVVLRGQFDGFDEDRHHAALGPAGADGVKAAGEIEVEARQIEGKLRNLAPRTTFTIAIDGREVGVATTDRRGDAEFDVES